MSIAATRPRQSNYASLGRADLVRLVPELLIAGHVIDRAGMPWCTVRWGPEEMAQIAIEEWMGASPVYTRRMQEALGFVGTDVATIFKGMQLDCGAPPRYMDFRYAVHDEHHGEFHLDHCGALMDVEPMGEQLVTLMCHDIEDPTFDATAIATSPYARMRPIHRPPRRPADQHPHCRWEVVIDESLEPLPVPPETVDIRATQAAQTVLEGIDPDDEGRSDYAGPLLSDIDVQAFSASALRRIADEVALQLHLLNISYSRAVLRRARDEQSDTILANQALGFAAIVAERMVRALEIEPSPAGALRLLQLHPVLNPAAYVHTEVHGDRVVVTTSPAHAEESWLRQCGPDRTEVLRGIVKAVDPTYDVAVTGTETEWQLQIVDGAAWSREPDAIAITRISGSTTFELGHRKAIPITPV